MRRSAPVPDATRRPRAAVGLDWGEHALKAVEVQRTSSGYEILRAVSVAVPDAVRNGTPAAVGEWLADTLRREGFRAAQAVWSIPRHRLILRWMQLPGGTPEEIAQMVRFQAGKDLPLPMDRLRYNYARLDEAAPPDGAELPAKTRVLFAAVPAEVADRAAAVVDAAGLAVQGAVPSMMATWALARAARPDLFRAGPGSPASGGEASLGPAAGPDPSPASTVLIDIGWGSCEVSWCDASGIRHSRSAPVGLSALTAEPDAGVAPAAPPPPGSAAPETPRPDPRVALRENAPLPPAAEAWVGRLLAEIGRTLRAWKTEPGGLNIGNVLLAGGGARWPVLQARIGAELGVPVAPLEPSGGLVGTAVPPASLDPSFATAAGAALAALGEDAPFLNLLGALEVRRRRLHGVLVAAGIAGAVLLTGGLVTGWVLLARREAELHAREAQIKELKPRVDQILQTEKQVALASQWGPNRVALADLLREITVLFPPEAYVTTMSVDESGLIRLSGRSKSNQVMSKLVNGLNGSPLFANAAMGAFTKNNDRGEFRYDYTITVQIRSLIPEKANGDKTKAKT